VKLIREINRIQQKLLDIQKRKGGINNGLYKRRFAKPRVIDITIILIKILSYRNNYEAMGPLLCPCDYYLEMPYLEGREKDERQFK